MMQLATLVNHSKILSPADRTLLSNFVNRREAINPPREFTLTSNVVNGEQIDKVIMVSGMTYKLVQRKMAVPK